MGMAAGLSQGAGLGVTGPGRPAVPDPPVPSVPSGPLDPPASPATPAPPRSAAARAGWTAPRVITLVMGSALILLALVLLGGTGVLAWADQEQQGGYLATGTAEYSTSGYALASDPVSLPSPWGWLGRFAGEVRIRVTDTNLGQPVFVAIGPAGDVSRYLAGLSYASVTAFGDHDVTQHPGTAVPAPPSTALHWAAQERGAGTQTLRWTVRSGDWMMVAMNPDGAPGVRRSASPCAH